MHKRHTLKKLVPFTLLTSILMAAVVGCGSTAGNSSATNESNQATTNTANVTPKKGGTLTIGVKDEPDTLDTHKSGMAAANTIMGNLGGGLVTQDPETKEFKPYLAESWNVSDDGKTWTFKVRKDIKFHDGTPLTAKAFAETYSRAKDPAASTKVASSNLASVESIEAPDDQTLVLHLKEPFAPLLQYLSDPGWLQPISLAAIEKSGDQYGRNPVGVGPWKFENWENGKSITFARNEEYKWGDPIFKNQAAPFPDKLVYKFISENQTMLAALESGSIDIASKVEAKDAKKYKNNPDYEVKEILHNGLGLYVMMNMRKPIFQDIEVRQAINQAINKDAIIRAVAAGEAVPANGPLPPTLFGYDEAVNDYGYKYSVEDAKKHLEKAGYNLNKDGIFEKDGKQISMDLLTLPAGAYAQSAQLIQAMLQAIGIKVNIVSLEFGALLEANNKGNYDLSVSANTMTDPDGLYMFFHSSQADQGLNTSFIKDKKVDELLEQGRSTIDSEKRKAIYKELQKYIVEQAWWVPVYVDKKFYIIKKPVEGVGIHPLRGMTLQDSWVNK